MAKVTVIIPCYNAEKYIEKCIKSIDNQSVEGIDIICIDDCSTDNTVSKLMSLKEECVNNLIILKNESNMGPAASRNRGILMAESEYIAFCDSDDWYDLDFLKLMIDAIEKNDANLAFCGYKVVDEKGKQELRPLCQVEKYNTVTEAIKLDVDSLCMMVVKTNIMKVTLLPDIRNGEDMAVVPLLIVKAGGFVAVKGCLYNYFRRSSSASQRPTMEVVKELEKSYKYIEENFPDGNDSVLEYIGIRNLLYAGLITLFSFSYDVNTAKRITNGFETRHSCWNKNKLIEGMPAYKKLVLKLLSMRWFWAIRLVAMIRNKITGIG